MDCNQQNFLLDSKHGVYEKECMKMHAAYESGIEHERKNREKKEKTEAKHMNIYDREALSVALEEDDIDDVDEAYMRGYLAA